MKKAILVVLTFISSGLIGQEQEVVTKNIEVKLYGNYDPTNATSLISANYYYDSVTNVSTRDQMRISHGFNFSPSLVVKNQNGNSSEFTLSRLKFLKASQINDQRKYVTDSTLILHSGLQQSLFDLHLRYEYKVALFKRKTDRKLRSVIGFSASPFITQHKVTPLSSAYFPVKQTNLGTYFSVIPRFEYDINQTWYIDFNVPFSIGTYTYSSFKADNPTIAMQERTTTTIGFDTSVNASFRLGIGIKL